MPGKPPPERQCTGDSKRRPGERCEAWAMKGKDVCYHHGGKSPTGAGSPHFRHGRRSKDLPARLSERYEEALSDSAYIELRDEVALLDARVGDVLSRVDRGESGRWIAGVKDAFKRFEKAERSRSDDAPEQLEEARQELRAAINGATLDYAAWEEIYGLIEQRRKLAETERRRMVDERQMISERRAMTFAGAVLALIRESVAGEENEREILARFHSGLARLIHQDAPGGTGGVPSTL